MDLDPLVSAIATALRAARAEGIEAAAKVADDAWCSHVAKPIRALKEPADG